MVLIFSLEATCGEGFGFLAAGELQGLTAP
jgi:hypothetical protein